MDKGAGLMPTPTVYKMTPAEIYDAAAWFLRDHGWLQGEMTGPNGEACAVGAMQLCEAADVMQLCDVVHINPNRYYRPFAEYLCEIGELDPIRFEAGAGGAIVWWNDQPGRTADDVITHLEKAAAWAREKVA